MELLKSVCANVRRDADADAPLWSESWSALHHLCGQSTLDGAAEILDRKMVTRLVARRSRREYFLVEGNGRGKSHTCVPGFCTCKSFCLSVAAKPDLLVCKHELAVLLAEPLGKLHNNELEDDEWAKAFSHAMTMPMMEYDPHLAASPVKDAPAQLALMP